MNAIAESYDRVPYPRSAYHYTHPDRLRVLASLLGLDAPPADNCRVLELGCASGANLIPLAYTLPKSTFVGIDLSSRQIEEGKKFAEAIGLANLFLQQRDVCAGLGDEEPFDYIIAHGFYSWAPPEVSEAALAMLGRLLSPRGVAYVSYNTFPAGHARMMIRRIAQFHVRDVDDPVEKAQQVRSLVRFLSQATPFAKQAYGAILRDQLHVLEHMSDAGILHEVLEDHNHPVLFSDFVAHADRHGLRYLGEATLADRPQLEPTVLQRLGPIRAQRGSIDHEQYLDFFNGQTFRRTLLCRREVELDGQAHLEPFDRFCVTSSAQPLGACDLNSAQPVEFETIYRQRFTLRTPLSKAAWLVLGEHHPRAMPFGELVAEIGRRRGKAFSDAERQTLAGELVGQFIFGKESVELWLQPPRVTTQPGERVRASAVARYQHEHGWPLVSLTHKMVQLRSEAAGSLLNLLDGSRSMTELKASQPGDVDIGECFAELARLGLLEA